MKNLKKFDCLCCVYHILSLAQYFRTNDVVHLRAQFVMYAHFLSVRDIQKSTFDCCKQIFEHVMNDQSIVLFDLDTCVDLYLYIFSHFFLFQRALKMSISKKKELKKLCFKNQFDQENVEQIFIKMYQNLSRQVLFI